MPDDTATISEVFYTFFATAEVNIDGFVIVNNILRLSARKDKQREDSNHVLVSIFAGLPNKLAGKMLEEGTSGSHCEGPSRWQQRLPEELAIPRGCRPSCQAKQHNCGSKQARSMTKHPSRKTASRS